MLALRSVPLMALLLMPIGCSREEATATNKEKIVGVWVVTKSLGSPNLQGRTWEFTKDGKLILTDKTDENPISIECEYTIEKDVLTLQPAVAMAFIAANPSKIQKLTKTDLTLEEKTDGKSYSIELRRNH